MRKLTAIDRLTSDNGHILGYRFIDENGKVFDMTVSDVFSNLQEQNYIFTNLKITNLNNFQTSQIIIETDDLISRKQENEWNEAIRKRDYIKKEKLFVALMTIVCSSFICIIIVVLLYGLGII